MSFELVTRRLRAAALASVLFPLLATGCASLKGTPAEPSIAEMIRGEDTRNAALVRRNMVDSNQRSIERGLLALGRIGDPADKGRLIKELKHENSRVRSAAAFALGEMFDKDTRAAMGMGVPVEVGQALMAALDDEERDVQATVIEALGKLGEKAAVQRLIGKLTEPDEGRDVPNERVAERAILALMRIGHPDALAPIEEMTANPSPRLRYYALNALLRMPGGAGRDRALALLEDEFPEVRSMAVRLLGKVGTPNDAIRLFAMKDDPSFAVFVEMLRAQAKLQNPDFPKILQPAVASIGQRALGDPNATDDGRFVNLAVTAIDTLAEFDPIPETMTLLQQLRGQDNVMGYRAQIAYAKLIKRSNSRLRFSDFPPGFRTDSVQAMRHLVMAWQELGGERGLAELDRMPFARLSLLHHEDQAELAKALTPLELAILPSFVEAYGTLLREQTGELPRDFVTFHLWSEDPYVCARAAGLLIPADPKKFPPAEMLRAVVEVLDYDTNPNPDGRRALVELLGRYPRGNTTVQAALTRALRDKSPAVRAGAMAALGNRKDADFSLLARTPGSWKLLSPQESPEGFYQRLARAQAKRCVVVIDVEDRGKFAVELFPYDAPITTENFLRLTRAGYFDGLSFHRVVPNFVAQGGDPRNDMEGGPGYSIPCEINQRRFRRGTLGMALSGKDTGGSQFFIALAPQPHLDGGYTIFGQVLAPEQAAEYSPELSRDIRGVEELDTITQFDRIRGVRYIVPGGR